VQVGQLSQLLLRQSAFQSEFADAPAENNPWVRSWHPAMMETLTTMSLHTISVISSAQFHFGVT
jgi:hypothetical protein